MATPNPPVAGTTEEAMNRVLGAEHDAKAAITECEALAAATVEQARQRARRIAERTDRRISRLHAACELAAARSIDLLLRQERGSDAQRNAPPHEQEVLAAAVERLAALLTGATPTPHDTTAE